MNLIDAMRQKDTKTENGMITNSSSLKATLNFFFMSGAMRKADNERIIEKFVKSFEENKDLTMKMLFWLRDIRFGIGERKVFRTIIKYMLNAGSEYSNALLKNIEYIPEYGRWDDLLEIFMLSNDNIISKKITDLIFFGLNSKNQLCAKWMPRQGKVANKLRTAFKLSPKEWRQLLVSLTNVVEQKMCANKWNQIEYNKLPSVAMSRYKTAFFKHDEEGIKKYIASLQQGKTTINTGAIYPYDVIRMLKTCSSTKERDLANEQWKALPNYLQDDNSKMLVVADTSGSMASLVSGSISCLDICISLAIYTSERNNGPFKDAFITFSVKPKLQILHGSLSSKIDQLNKSDWDCNTDLSAVFEVILSTAVNNNVHKKDMPKYILIISDMEFDSCNRESRTAIEDIKIKYKHAGYKLPNIVFWNIQSRHDNIPVKFDKTGTGLISGFSPSIIKCVLNGDINPTKIMLRTILTDRYEKISV